MEGGKGGGTEGGSEGGRRDRRKGETEGGRKRWVWIINFVSFSVWVNPFRAGGEGRGREGLTDLSSLTHPA